MVCVFDRGTARIYVNGKLLKSESGIAQKTDDKTAPGRMGNTGVAFDAVSDVIVRTDSSDGTKPAKERKKASRYRVTLRDIRIYNRALSKHEIRDHGEASRCPMRQIALPIRQKGRVAGAFCPGGAGLWNRTSSRESFWGVAAAGHSTNARWQSTKMLIYTALSVFLRSNWAEYPTNVMFRM